jgi:hypothetical protein
MVDMLHVLILIAALTGTAFAPRTTPATLRLAPAAPRPTAATPPLPATSPSVPGRRWRDVSPGGPV